MQRSTDREVTTVRKSLAKGWISYRHTISNEIHGVESDFIHCRRSLAGLDFAEEI
jgi:hypothetical protein